ncbi:MAG: penicillin acylase family protein [Anaerolineae bacterium]
MSRIHDILGPVARLGITAMSRGRLPQTEGAVTLPGLTAEVEVFRDRWGIPHIYAQSRRDLFFAQGFVHAQDRLWQMELNRRTGHGRLSELFGDLALDTDRTIRTFGFNRLGRADWENGDDDVRLVIQAYTDGVNAFLAHPDSKLPVEFSLLRHKPEPWQPEDTAVFIRVMIWQLSHAWHGELVRAQIAEAVGAERAADLEIRYPAANPITLPNGIEFNVFDPNGMLGQATGPFLDRGKGSNAWAVAGRKSDTGHAILCNDMHLMLTLPSLWYEMHLHAGEYHVTGVTLPGVPMVLVGHNAHIAWGMTLAFTDCEDLFIEQFDPDLPYRYRFEDEWLEAEAINEPIRVKGRDEPHIEQVLVTRHGPVISDVVGYPAQRVAVQSMALRPSPALKGWLFLNAAQNWNEFVEAMRLIEAPQLNVSYADVEDNIGHWVTGKVPVRAKGDGRVPVPGWTGEYEWVGEVPFAEMPHAFNPEQGFVVSCNHRIVPDDYPHFLGEVWMNGYRARRLTAFMEAKETLSSEDFQAMHMDVTCLPGLEFVERLAGLESEDPDVQLALAQLRAWDGRLTPDSVGGCLYEVARYTLVRNLLEPGLGQELTLRWMGKGFHPLLMFAHEFFGHDTVTMLRLLDDEQSWWVEQAGGRTAVITRSLKEAVSWLRSELGPDVARWQWGRIHQISFEHPLGLQQPLDRVFNRGPFPIGGDTDTPCQTAMNPHEPYDTRAWAPSFRMIADMGDLSRSLAIFPPGQSGHLASPHYDDLIRPWLDGEYHPMLWTREQVEQEAEGKLVLSRERQ